MKFRELHCFSRSFRREDAERLHTRRYELGDEEGKFNYARHKHICVQYHKLHPKYPPKWKRDSLSEKRMG